MHKTKCVTRSLFKWSEAGTSEGFEYVKKTKLEKNIIRNPMGAEMLTLAVS